MKVARMWPAYCAALLLFMPATAVFAAEPWPTWLPRYDASIDLDVKHHRVEVSLHASWTNPQQAPTRTLVFNAHSRYVVPKSDIGLTAKTLELLRLSPDDSLGEKEPALQIARVLLESVDSPRRELPFHYEGDTKTSLVVQLPHEVGPSETVTVLLELSLRLPPKQGRWGQWEGVTTLSNWLPVFAYYGPRRDPPTCPPSTDRQSVCEWQPTPFLPWHQPFFNEAAHYRTRLTLPGDQQLACTGSVAARRELADGRQQVDIVAHGVRDFALLCSARYRVFEGRVNVPVEPSNEDTLPKPRPLSSLEVDEKRGSSSKFASDSRSNDRTRPVLIRVLAFPEHEHYAREMVRIATEAITAYSKWFGPYPWPEFTIAESFFGWNGNECSTLVMIDARVFNLPHLAGGFVDSLVSHEICHQWWYNVVGTNGYCETWMDESLATYFGHRLLDQKIGKNNNFMKYPRGFGWLPNIERETYRSYGLLGTLGRGENGPSVQPMSGFGNVVTLFSMTYDKGSRIVGLIEDRLGSAAFLDFMSGVFRRYRYRILRVADFQRELEAYTGQSWEEFFKNWLYGPGLTDWCIERVSVDQPKGEQHATTRIVVELRQKADINEQTTLGFALPGREGYPIRIPIVPRAEPYNLDEPPAHIEALDENRVRVEVCLPEKPEQIAVDPDQILVDRDPSNNFWKPRLRTRITPLYTFLDETDITTSYDRWNFILGPWLYGTAYYDAWYPRTMATMLGFRAAVYRTQLFTGGLYAGYRTDYRDVVAGVDGLFDHWPGSHFQVGYDFEQRLAQFYPGQADAKRGVLFGRYIFKYGSSLYYPPMEFAETFLTYQDNFLPYEANPSLPGTRFNETATAGFHYRKDYLTPYWDPVGGYRWDVWYQGGTAIQPSTVGMQEISSQFSFVKSLPDFSESVGELPWLAGPLHWLGQSRVAFRIFGGTAMPGRGEFFSMGGSMYFRGFDLAQRQGSSIWIGSVEWRLPAARNLHLDFLDHIATLHGIDVVPFTDIGNVYISGRQVGSTAYDVGASLRLDVSWFSFVERTMLRLDIAKTVNVNSGVQVWFGWGVPF
jgi:hypothetical protein